MGAGGSTEAIAVGELTAHAALLELIGGGHEAGAGPIILVGVVHRFREALEAVLRAELVHVAHPGVVEVGARRRAVEAHQVAELGHTLRVGGITRQDHVVLALHRDRGIGRRTAARGLVRRHQRGLASDLPQQQHLHAGLFHLEVVAVRHEHLHVHALHLRIEGPEVAVGGQAAVELHGLCVVGAGRVAHAHHQHPAEGAGVIALQVAGEVAGERDRALLPTEVELLHMRHVEDEVALRIGGGGGQRGGAHGGLVQDVELPGMGHEDVPGKERRRERRGAGCALELDGLHQLHRHPGQRTLCEAGVARPVALVEQGVLHASTPRLADRAGIERATRTCARGSAVVARHRPEVVQLAGQGVAEEGRRDARVDDGARARWCGAAVGDHRRIHRAHREHADLAAPEVGNGHLSVHIPRSDLHGVLLALFKGKVLHLPDVDIGHQPFLEQYRLSARIGARCDDGIVRVLARKYRRHKEIVLDHRTGQVAQRRCPREDRVGHVGVDLGAMHRLGDDGRLCIVEPEREAPAAGLAQQLGAVEGIGLHAQGVHSLRQLTRLHDGLLYALVGVGRHIFRRQEVHHTRLCAQHHRATRRQSDGRGTLVSGFGTDKQTGRGVGQAAFQAYLLHLRGCIGEGDHRLSGEIGVVVHIGRIGRDDVERDDDLLSAKERGEE